MSDAPAADFTPLSEDERTKLLDSVEGLIIRKVVAACDRTADREDWQQECRMLVWRESARFDPGRGVKFSTFAGDILDTLLRRMRVDLLRKGPQHDVRSLDDDGYRDSLAGRDPADESVGLLNDDIDAALMDLRRTATRVGFAPLFETLGTVERQVIELVVVDGLNHYQAAGRLGVQPKWAWLQVVAAVRKLAAAGHVPPDLAAGLGLDAADLARRGDATLVARDRAARRELVREAGGDADTKTLAAQLGVPVGAVQKDRKVLRLGRTLRPRPAPVGAALAEARRERNARMVALVAAGRTHDSVADEFGVNASTVYRAVAAAAGRSRRSLRQAAA